MSKQDHRVVVERVLRPGAMLRVLARVGIGSEGVAAGGRLGTPWNRAGIGERTTRGVHPSRRWRGGGGRAAARGEGLHRRQGRAEQSTCSGKKKRGEGVRGTCLEFSRSLGTSR
jgi:hypothetical protein